MHPVSWSHWLVQEWTGDLTWSRQSESQDSTRILSRAWGHCFLCCPKCCNSVRLGTKLPDISGNMANSGEARPRGQNLMASLGS